MLIIISEVYTLHFRLLEYLANGTYLWQPLYALEILSKILLGTKTYYPSVVPAQAGIQTSLNWAAARAGVTIILQLIN
jgi:hypothetical protein